MGEAAVLRADLQRLIAGGADRSGAVDPFNERNEHEESKRKTNAAAAQSSAPRSRSRRAQQAAAKDRATTDRAEMDGSAAADPSSNKTPRQAKGIGASSATPSVEPASRVLLPACASWWNTELATPPGAQCASPADEAELRISAANAYDAEVGAFDLAQRRKHGADHRIVQRLTSAGTAKDRIAALTLQAQESSFHCLPHVRSLLSLAERPHKDIKVSATEALTELFCRRLLPPRPLVPFERHELPVLAARRGGNGGGGAATQLPASSLAYLMRVHFESELHALYARFVALVEDGAKDTIPHLKLKYVGTLYTMLVAKPEQERRLLASLINKLGDPDKKGSALARARRVLRQLSASPQAL